MRVVLNKGPGHRKTYDVPDFQRSIIFVQVGKNSMRAITYTPSVANPTIMPITNYVYEPLTVPNPFSKGETIPSVDAQGRVVFSLVRSCQV